VPEHAQTTVAHLTLTKSGAQPYVERREYMLPLTVGWLRRNFHEDRSWLVQAMIAPLAPNGKVLPHIDAGAFYRGRARHHLVITSASGCWFRCGDENITMHQGQLWWFDNSIEHACSNLLPNQPRTHLIFDTEPLA